MASIILRDKLGCAVPNQSEAKLFTSGFLQPGHGTVSIPPREPKLFANLAVPSLDYIFAHYLAPVKPNEK
jgi:hypothetical protein